MTGWLVGGEKRPLCTSSGPKAEPKPGLFALTVFLPPARRHAAGRRYCTAAFGPSGE
jgi:hypothetical protein